MPTACRCRDAGRAAERRGCGAGVSVNGDRHQPGRQQPDSHAGRKRKAEGARRALQSDDGRHPGKESADRPLGKPSLGAVEVAPVVERGDAGAAPGGGAARQDGGGRRSSRKYFFSVRGGVTASSGGKRRHRLDRTGI